MRLLDAWHLIHEGVAELVEFADEDSAPPYAILSHTWATEEVLFEDIALGPDHETQPTAASIRASRRRNQDTQDTEVASRPHVKAGWNKVLNTCLQACRDGLEYVWIDTCCINKSSSAELSLAINSMFRWYKNAAICYAYLADCTLCPDIRRKKLNLEYNILARYDILAESRCMRKQFQKGRWFTRGWTLQELIAPSEVHFFDRHWRYIASKSDITPSLASITGIHIGVLKDESALDSFCIAPRMSWAARRRTTRIEDEAYCLLGIFRVNMPLLYGEGAVAFQHFQQEILKGRMDDSILAWELLPHEASSNREDLRRLFAPSPAHFWYHARYIGDTLSPRTMVAMNQWIQFEGDVANWQHERDLETRILVLSCIMQPVASEPTLIGIRMRKLAIEVAGSHSSEPMHLQVDIDRFESRSRGRLVHLKYLERTTPLQTRILMNPDTISSSYGAYSNMLRGSSVIRVVSDMQPELHVMGVYPGSQWNASNNTLTLPLSDGTLYAAVSLLHSSKQKQFLVLFRLSSSLVSRQLTVSSFRPGGLWTSTFKHASGYCQYWIFPLSCPMFVLSEPLWKVCQDVPSFFAKDYFEYNDSRLLCNKSVPLDDATNLSPQLRGPAIWQDEGVLKMPRPRVDYTLDLEVVSNETYVPAPEYGARFKNREISLYRLATNRAKHPARQRVNQCYWDVSAGGTNLLMKTYYAMPESDGSIPKAPKTQEGGANP